MDDIDYYEESYTINRSDDCFLFYYESEFSMHFEIPSTNNGNSMGYVNYLEEGGGALNTVI